MAPGFTKVSQGQRLSETPIHTAPFINDTINAINFFKDNQNGNPTETPTGAIWDTDLVKVQNLTGSDVIRGQVVQLGDELPATRNWRFPWFEGNIVADPVTQKIAIILIGGPTMVGLQPPAIVLACVSGRCTAQVDVSDVTHKFATAVAGSVNLASATSGPIQILSPLTDTGVQELWVLLSAGSTIETRIVAIDDDETPDGESIGPTGGCIWPGLIMGLSEGEQNFCDNPWTPTPTIGGEEVDEVKIWISIIDLPGGSGTSGLKMTVGDRFIGRYIEDYTLTVDDEDDTRPLYAIRKGIGPLRRFELYTDLVFGTGSALAKPLNWDSGGSTWLVEDTAEPFTVYDPFIAGGSDFVGKGPLVAAKGYQGFCQLQPDSGLYEIVYLEHKSIFVKGTLYQQLKSSDTTQANCTMTDFWQGRNPDPAALNITVQNEGLFWGPTGAVFYAMWDDNDSQWNLIWVQHQARFAYAQLNADMASGSSSAATVVSYWDGISPGSTVDVKDPSNFFKRALNGAAMLVTFNESANSGAGQYECVEGQSKGGHVMFTLTADMSGGSAACTFASGDQWGSQQDTQQYPTTGTVFDKTGHFARALSGAKGIAAFDMVNNKAWIIECDQETLSYSGTVGALTNSTSSASVGSLKGMNSTPFGQVTTSSTVTAFNVYGLACAATTQCLIHWNRANAQWEIAQVAHIVQTTDVDIQYDSSGNRIQVKTRDLVVMPNSAVSSFTNKIAFTQYSYVSAVAWDGTNLTYHNHTNYGPNDADGGDHNINTPDTC